VQAFDINPSSIFSLALLDAEFTGESQEPQSDWPSPAGQSVPDSRVAYPHVPPWKRLPLYVEATCQLDTVLLELIASSRQHLQASGELPEVSFPSIKSLLNPAARNVHNPISNALGQHGKVTMAVPSSTERIACLYYMSLLVRWLIAPTKQNFDAIPAFLKPIEAQLTKPHPIWIDTIVWYEL